MTQPTAASIATAVRECLAEILEAPPAKIPEEADLRQDLDVDSLQQLELVTMLEERFGIFLDANDLSAVDSIGDLVDRAVQQLGAAG